MTWHSTTDTWAGVDDRTTVMRAPKAARRPRKWSMWVLPALAFVCGALVSAAVFTIGWRHQTQQNVAAQTALATETARNHALTASLVKARATIARDEQIATQARASLRAAQASGATIAAEAGAAQANATSVSSSAASMATAAGKIANELKTLTTYLITTPTSQLDAGYIDSQAAYLTRQVAALQSDGGTIASAVGSFDAAIQKLKHLAATLSAQK